MTLASPSKLLAFLKTLGVHPKKALSQNFLIDANIVRKIVDLAAIQPEDHVMEIGPGPGALTEEILQRGACVTAIEKDTLFAKALHRLQNGKLSVIEGDILNFSWDPVQKPIKIIGNLPYSISTPIIEAVCKERPLSFTFMVQKELAQRLMAPPGTRNCGSISVFIQSQATIGGSFPVPRTCFYPSPAVDSTVLTLRFDREPPPPAFFTLVRTAFQQRRKMLSSSLKTLFPQIKQALCDAHISATARPETLTLAQWQALFSLLPK